jgi:PPM family protein phosphatase
VRIEQAAGDSDTGRKRRRNEDAFVVRPPLFGVADGMGGAQAGELASSLAAAAMKESALPGGDPERRVVQLIQEANRRVHERASNDAAASGMGTTMTVALVEPDGRVAFGHVGDSRAYMVRGGRLEQLTDDHSLVAELVRRGELSAAEAEVHPQRSVITRALGTDPDVDVDAFSVDAQPGDIFLICSDGLSSFVGGEMIEEIIVRNHRDLKGAVRALIQAANRGGGDDNITAVLFRVVEGDGDAPSEPDERTRELVTAPDEEDTLHPEDAIAPPPPADGNSAEPPAADDTMVMSASDLRAAIADAQDTPVPQAGLGRRLLALLVILALVVVIVVLVWWGLAR